MATPSKKSPKMEAELERLYGRTSAITSDVCAACGGPAVEFVDDVSRKEYTISGMCQTCQDAYFTDEWDENEEE